MELIHSDSDDEQVRITFPVEKGSALEESSTYAVSDSSKEIPKKFTVEGEGKFELVDSQKIDVSEKFWHIENKF